MFPVLFLLLTEVLQVPLIAHPSANTPNTSKMSVEMDIGSQNFENTNEGRDTL
jgi:hypothetical protein